MEYFKKVLDEDSAIRQGDIFQIGSECSDNFMEEETLAMVITADCDIAQNKMGEYYTLLPIISVEHYIETRVIPRIFKTDLKSKLKLNIDKLNISIKNSEFDLLTEESILKWLEFDTLEKIYNSLELKIDKKILDDSKQISILLDEPSLESFTRLRVKEQNKNIEKVRKEISDFICKNLGEQFMFIPEIPCISGLGCIIKMRDVRSLHRKNVYKSDFEVKMSKLSKDKGIIRIGKFSDYLRYSISQKFGLLFSRIGMPEKFESDVSESLSLMTKNMLEQI